MKKILALVLALSLALSLALCANAETEEPTVMTYEEFVAAAIDDEVTVETYIQAKQGWWTDESTGVSQASFYTQAEDGAYFLYNMPCSEEEYAQLVPGTKIRVTGYKAEWSGEVEIIDTTFEILEGEYIAEATDVTELFGTDDLYFKATLGDTTYDFCVEFYLCGKDTDVYKAVEGLQIGDTVDLEGFLYWYNGPNLHTTGIGVKVN